MIKKLQLVVLGWVVVQGATLFAMETRKKSEEIRVTVKHPVKKMEKDAKRQCLNLSKPKYIELEGRDWPAELQKNPDLAWLPI